MICLGNFERYLDSQAQNGLKNYPLTSFYTNIYLSLVQNWFPPLLYLGFPKIPYPLSPSPLSR
jgi:hypothetical protein